MSLPEIWRQLLDGLFATTWIEFIAVVFGILSVLFSRVENIWVYPTGLINTTLYIYLSLLAGLYAEASVNAYYTLMSVIGWVMWTRKSDENERLQISVSSLVDVAQHPAFFCRKLVGTLVCAEPLHQQHIARGRCIRVGVSLHRNVADDAQETGKLGMVDHHQPSLHSTLLFQRVCLHQLPIPGIFSIVRDGIPGMETKNHPS
jgi:hypothetical protein